MTALLSNPATDNDAALIAAAEALLIAERQRHPIAPLSSAMPTLSEADAYRIARHRVALCGKATIGYKLGYTSAAMRAQMGIDEPNYGVMLDGTAITDGGKVPLDELIHPLVEPEIAFVMGQDLPADGITQERAWAAVEAVAASLEIVDTRYQSYSFQAVDNIADNSSAARYVLGEKVARADAPALPAVTVQLREDDAQIDAGTGANALGDPVLTLVWLARALAQAGRGIKAGDVVLTGGLTRAYPAKAGSRFSAAFDGLGTVLARF